jgi:tRNA pseudouridine55 synthase
MVSARKVEGARLYELARRGEVVEREARPVEIHTLEVIDFAPSDYPEVTFRTVCSTGTYVRTLGDDIARALGGRGHLTALRRTRNGDLVVSDALTVGTAVEAIADGRLNDLCVDPSDVLAGYPEFVVDATTELRVRNGAKVPVGGSHGYGEGSLVRIVSAGGELLGVYRQDQQVFVPEVVLQ